MIVIHGYPPPLAGVHRSLQSPRTRIFKHKISRTFSCCQSNIILQQLYVHRYYILQRYIYTRFNIMYMYIGQYRYAHRTRFIAMFFVRSHLSLLSNSPTPGTVGLFFKFNFSSSKIRAFKRAVKNIPCFIKRKIITLIRSHEPYRLRCFSINRRRLTDVAE